jgi:hypothetical protein
MLRIDPAHPPLWRTATTLQFGVPPVAVVEDPTPWQQRLVRDLERGLPEDAVVSFAHALGATPEAADEFIGHIAPALAADARRRSRVIVQGAGEVPRTHLEAVAAGFDAAGGAAEVAHPFDPPGAGAIDPDRGAAVLVVVAHHVVTPAFAAALMSDDLPHLPIVLTGSGAHVGPYVVPGTTACLSCLAATERERDPAWPAIAAQLLGRPVEAAETATLWEAGITGARLISESAQRLDRPWTRSLTLHSGSLRRSARRHRPHAECRCRSLAGTVTAVAPARPEPMTPTAFARLA